MSYRRLLLCLALLGLFASACDSEPSSSPDASTSPDAAVVDAGSDAGMTEPPPVLEITPMDPPLAVPDGVVFSTLAYGPGEQQVMDVLIHPDAAAPTPVVIFIHGGGFTGGSRTSAYGSRATELVALLERGVAYVTIDYTLLTPGTETEGAIKCLRDAQRALQFVRYYADTLNIDGARVGLMGGSAGAGTSLWLAFHDEMADAEGDAFAQQSTRVSAVSVSGTQATYELLRWPGDVFMPTYTLTIEELLATPSLAAQVATFYGLPLVLVGDPDMLEAELRTPDYVAYREELDMLAWMSPDDPPFHVRNTAVDAAPGAAGFDLLHHPLHAQALADRAAEVGHTDAVVEAPALGLGGDVGSAAFMLEQLVP